MRFLRYDWAGAALGVALVLVATVLAAWDRDGSIVIGTLLAVHGSEPLLWLIDTAPFVAGALGWAIERQRGTLTEQQLRIARLERQRRATLERTAEELSGAALNLLAGVSSLGAASAQMTASVRGTIDTTTGLSHGATAMALAAETVAGRALDATSRPGATAEELAATLATAASGAKEIARVAQEQMNGIDRVLAAMNEIHFATEAGAASAQEIAAEARALARRANGARKSACSAGCSAGVSPRNGAVGEWLDPLDAVQSEAKPNAAASANSPPPATDDWLAA